jgi:hypothetical protein
LAVRCSGVTRSGTRCERSADGPNGLCWAHDPAHADKRRRLASKAGKAKPDRELAGIKERLSDLADNVLEEKVDKGVAAVASQVLNVCLRAISMEMKLREVEELERRMDEIEAMIAARKERPWGA